MFSMAYRKKSRLSPERLHSLVFGLVLLLGAETVGAQIRTVLVSPVPGNPIASGTALKNALAGISSPSATNRWLLKIEPGIYDIGTNSLVMRSWVDIEGSGIGVTTISGKVDAGNGTINGANNSELRLLTVETTGEIVFHNTFRAAMVNHHASPRLYRVRFSSVGAGEVFGIYNQNSLESNSAPLIEECEISATHLVDGLVVGVEFDNFSNSSLPAGRSVIMRSKIAVTGGGNNYGLRLQNSQFVSEIRDSRIDVTGGQNSYGIFAQQAPNWAWRGHELMQIRNTEIDARGGSSASYGINTEPAATIAFEISGSEVWGRWSPTNYGIRQGAQAVTVVQWSHVIGSTQTIQAAHSVSIQSTYLQGGPATAQVFLGCMGVWDENAVFYAQGACP